RRRRAVSRLEQLEHWLSEPLDTVQRSLCTGPASHAGLAPQFPVPGPPGLTSNFSADAYRDAVQRCIDYIYAGDIFQVNFAQRLLYPAQGDSVSLYLRLRNRNPATFAAYLDLGEAKIVSASPERFLS